MDPNKYPNIFRCHIIYPTNIGIYLDATFLPNKYPNVSVSGYVSGEVAQIRIQIIFKGHLF